VTLGFLVTRRITPVLAGVYWVAQFLGALIAAALLTWLVPNSASDPVKLGTPVLRLWSQRLRGARD
jgi:glycerol uptake facilitator-like aquaporin